MAKCARQLASALGFTIVFCSVVSVLLCEWNPGLLMFVLCAQPFTFLDTEFSHITAAQSQHNGHGQWSLAPLPRPCFIGLGQREAWGNHSRLTA